MYRWEPALAPKHQQSPPGPPSPVIDPNLESQPAPPKSPSPKPQSAQHSAENATTSSSATHNSDDKPEQIDYNNQMPGRVEPYPMHHRRPYDRRHSPPPIATLTHSPSPSVASLDRSSVSTPPVHQRRSSPQAPLGAGPIYYQDPRQHQYQSRDPVPASYVYSHPNFDHRRYQPDDPAGHYISAPQSVHPGPPPPPRGDYQLPYPVASQGGSASVIYTEDAATKLSDRVRRRCFNCCTTDTSTWRRSNLSPGKVLCNKCGLFERTHSRPRPDQFPHKRGPLASSTLRSRSPQSSSQLPPISPPYQYQQHPSSIPPLSTTPPDRKHQYSQLPNIGSWHGEPGPGPLDGPSSNRDASNGTNGRLPTPPGSARSQPLQLSQETHDTSDSREPIPA